jgi:hypothetical protein
MVKTNKSGQMKIQQMAFMLIATILFFVLIGIVVLSFSLSGLKESATLLEEKNAVFLASKISNSPEFSCGDGFGTSYPNCIDTDKVMLLKQNIEQYSGFWNVKNIEIRKTYPVFEQDIICDISTYPNCNVIKVISEEFEGVAVSNYVSLCRKESLNGIPYDRCEIGKIIISYDIK